MAQSSEVRLQFTPTFLNSVLQPVIDAGQGTVINVRSEKLVGEGKFNATLWRLVLTYDRPFTTAPQSLIAKLPTADTELHERALIFQPGLRENWFYRAGVSRSPVHVPYCYYNSIDRATHQSILLLEDLAPATTGSWLEGLTLPQAELALTSLARLHASWWTDAASVEVQELTQLLSKSWSGEQNLVQTLYDTAWPQFLEQEITPIPDEVRHFGGAIVGNMKLVDALTDRAPKTLVHGDYRLDNLLFGSANGRPICWVIDWEDVFFGSGLVDVSWFLGGGLPVEESHHEVTLLRHYYRTLVDGGVKAYSWDQCYDDYRCAMSENFVQGILSATLNERASQYDHKVAPVVAQRFMAAVQRLQLQELLA